MSHTNKDSVSTPPTTLISNRLRLIIIFVVLEIFIVLFFRGDYRRHDDMYRAQMMQTFDANYRGATASYDHTTQMIFNDVVNKPEVLKLIASALDDKNRRDDYRNELYRLMLPSYERQKAIGILQFHFHLKDGTSLLRMHAPKRYGDNLFRRTAVYQVNKKQNPVKGYEVGYFADGYRFMYPLFYNGRHVGSVEFGITAEGIIDYLNQIYPAHYIFMINRTIVDNMTYADWKKRNYRESGLSDSFVVGQEETEDATVVSINQKIKNKVSDSLARMEQFVEKETVNGKDHLVVFLPVKDVTGKTAAYFAQYVTDYYSGHHSRLAMIDIALFTILLAAIFYSIDNVQSGRRSLEKKNIELEQMTETLHKSEKKYRDMFESATDSIFILDLDGNFIDVNSIAYSRLGYSKEEMLSLHISQLDPPEFAAKLPERLAKLRDHGFAIFESAHIRKDRTVMPVEVNARLYDYEGKKVYLSFIRDITERKKAEHNLQKAEQEIRTIYNSIAGHLTVVDRNFRIVSFNSVVEKQFGSAIKGKLCYEVYQGRSHVCPDCAAKTTFETGKPAFIFMPATSVSNPFEIYTSPVFDEQGEIVSVVEHSIEVTEKVKALEALKESEERFKALTESTSDWIWAVNENAIYTYASPKIKDLLGYEPKEIIGMTPFDFMPQEEARRVAEEFGEIIKAKRPIERLENVNLHKDGHLVVLETSAVPISDAEGYFRGYRGIDRDITERKKMEIQVRASLEEKEILLKEIHHRVKNNMTIIYSLLDLQSKFTSERHDRKMLNDAKARIKAMALIHEKLYRSKDMAKIDFSDYLSDLLNNMLMSYVKDPGRIALKIEVRDVTLGIDDAIPCGLIINELVSNTLKHSFPDGRKGEITVCMLSYDKDMIELIVADNGVGLPADLDSRKKASMGLSLVDALVNQLHGEIELHEGEGARFRITFRSHK